MLLVESVMQINYGEQTFERIKSNRKLGKLLAVEFESSKKSIRKKDKTKRDERKSKWNIEPDDD